MNTYNILNRIKKSLDDKEKKFLSPFACLSTNALRRVSEEKIECGHRQNFSLDADRIMHSHAYSRYIDKTQVFYLVQNDHITHRVLHVQFVSKISRTIGRLLGLNEDLLEAISLGHDIGHAPFGHDGEKFLTDLSKYYGLKSYQHNIQSVRALEKIEKKGKGWNLSLQVLDGILCHDGELHKQELFPNSAKGFDFFDMEKREKENNPSYEIYPMTMEGCVVRMADTISYIGRDIEDAIRLGLINREDLPVNCRKILGDTNGTIVYTLVEDLVSSSLDKPYVCFSPEVGAALNELKKFNQDSIYTIEMPWKQTEKIRLMFKLLFENYFEALEKGCEDSVIYSEFLKDMSSEYRDKTTRAEVVRDFIAGMTDEYFLAQCRKLFIPQIRSAPF